MLLTYVCVDALGTRYFIMSSIFLMQLHEGVKKSGIMGFCDPCPGEPKQLYVEYTYGGKTFEVTIPTNMSSHMNTYVGFVILVVLRLLPIVIL